MYRLLLIYLYITQFQHPNINTKYTNGDNSENDSSSYYNKMYIVCIQLPYNHSNSIKINDNNENNDDDDKAFKYLQSYV